MGRPLHLALVASAFLALAPAADAAVRTKVDWNNEVRFKLSGETLSLTIIDRERFTQSPTIRSELLGQRVGVSCGTSFRYSPKDTATKVMRWPGASRSASVRFARDLSRRAKWCLIEETGEYAGVDIAFVSFRRAEPGRRLTSGRLAGGTMWRIVAWRGNRLQPCVALSLRGWRSTKCFDDQAEVEAEIEAAFDVPPCTTQTFLLGVTSRSTAAVTVRLSDGSSAAAVLRRRPRGSRVRAQYFTALLPSTVEVEAVEASDSEGRLIGRDRHVDGSRPECPEADPS
jgi:hypothetical protein